MSSYERPFNEMVSILEGDLISTPEYPIIRLLSKDPIMRNLTRTIGVYAVYWRGDPLYAGKSTAQLLSRLRNHRNKLSTVPELVSLDDVTCKAIRVVPIRAVASVEEILIDNLKPILIGTDFGSNSDPARDSVEMRPNRKCWKKTLAAFIKKRTLTGV